MASAMPLVPNGSFAAFEITRCHAVIPPHQEARRQRRRRPPPVHRVPRRAGARAAAPPLTPDRQAQVIIVKEFGSVKDFRSHSANFLPAAKILHDHRGRRGLRTSLLSRESRRAAAAPAAPR